MMNNFTNLNNYLIHVNSILDDLVFMENSADSFEKAINDIATIIGIHASRPDKEGVRGGPDNLWAIDNLKYFVIECKNGVKPDITAISKSDCSQLLSSIQWFENLYVGNNYTCYPIIIHRADKFDTAASPNPNMRIMTEKSLDKFKTAIRSFTESLVSNKNIAQDVKEIQKLLIQFKLTGENIVDNYTIQAK